MATVVLTIHLLLALALIIVVLLQRSEGGGLGIGGGGGGLMTGRSAATALAKVTWVLGTAFVVTSLAMTIIAARDSGGGSVIDSVMPGASAPATGTPDLGDDLLPPIPGGGQAGGATPAPGGAAVPQPAPSAAPQPAPSAPPAGDGPILPPAAQ